MELENVLNQIYAILSSGIRYIIFIENWSLQAYATYALKLLQGSKYSTGVNKSTA